MVIKQEVSSKGGYFDCAATAPYLYRIKGDKGTSKFLSGKVSKNIFLNSFLFLKELKSLKYIVSPSIKLKITE